MNKPFTASEAKALASKLRDILDSHGHQLKHTESLEIISKLEGAPDWNTYLAHLKTLEQNLESKNSAPSHSTSDKQKKPDEDRLLYCSFCGKSQHEVHKLIAGPSVFICDECVDLCIEIIVEEQSEVPDAFGNMPHLKSLIQDVLDDKNKP